MPALAPTTPQTRSAPGLLVALAASAAATTIVSLWIVWTALTLLPARDPAHVPMWLGIAAGFLVFAAATFVSVRRGPLLRIARPLAGVFGVAACGMGLGTVTRVAMRGAGGHFEGYLVAIGVVFAVHGALALVTAFVDPEPAA